MSSDPETNLPKPEWGTKRTCANCGARFYDLARATIICPACSAPYDLESAGRTRRSRGTSRVVAAAVEEEVKEVEEVDEEEIDEEDEEDEDVVATDAEPSGDSDDDEPVTDDEEDEEDQSLIEDASELGDDDDVSEVIDGDMTDEEQI